MRHFGNHKFSAKKLEKKFEYLKKNFSIIFV